ncbi:hypothetical protein PtB15_6B604 [Puccinia triticina]|nr:hypothetical protein PtB15_6B604 [Puccinia triticina]
MPRDCFSLKTWLRKVKQELQSLSTARQVEGYVVLASHDALRPVLLTRGSLMAEEFLDILALDTNQCNSFFKRKRPHGIDGDSPACAYDQGSKKANGNKVRNLLGEALSKATHGTWQNELTPALAGTSSKSQFELSGSEKLTSLRLGKAVLGAASSAPVLRLEKLSKFWSSLAWWQVSGSEKLPFFGLEKLAGEKLPDEAGRSPARKSSQFSGLETASSLARKSSQFSGLETASSLARKSSQFCGLETASSLARKSSQFSGLEPPGSEKLQVLRLGEAARSPAGTSCQVSGSEKLQGLRLGKAARSPPWKSYKVSSSEKLPGVRLGKATRYLVSPK